MEIEINKKTSAEKQIELVATSLARILIQQAILKVSSNNSKEKARCGNE